MLFDSIALRVVEILQWFRIMFIIMRLLSSEIRLGVSPAWSFSPHLEFLPSWQRHPSPTNESHIKCVKNAKNAKNEGCSNFDATLVHQKSVPYPTRTKMCVIWPNCTFWTHLIMCKIGTSQKSHENSLNHFKNNSHWSVCPQTPSRKRNS